MSANLVIVESPAKAKTIQKFLGKSYKVIASNGHVRDLPKSTLGIDVENDFELVTILCYCFHKDIRLTPNQRSILAYVCATACNNDSIYYQQDKLGNKYPVWIIDDVLEKELSGCIE